VTVSKEITRLEHSAIQVTITVGKEDLKTEYDAIVSDYRKTLQIPGFRKGKVPEGVLQRKFGDSLKAEALGRILEHAVSAVLEDPELPPGDRPLPYATPAVQGEPTLNLETDLVFSVVYDVMPQLTLGPWQGFEVEVPQVSITEADINRELEVLQERNAIVFDKDDAAAAGAGDVLTITFAELSDTGDLIAGSERQDFVFTLGSGQNVYHLDDELVGMKRGETREIHKTYPADFYDMDLAGTSKKIRVTLTALKEKDLPELNDDFAQDVDAAYQTLEDLKASIKARLTEDLERRLRVIQTQKLMDQVIASNPVDLPESMIRLQLENQWRNVARSMHIPEEDVPNLLQKADGSSASLAEAWRPEAIRSLQSRLVLEALIQAHHITVSAEALEAEFALLAQRSKLPLEEIRAYYEPQERREYLEESLKERHVYDLLLRENTIKTGASVSYQDLVKR
jgi:trigger factor